MSLVSTGPTGSLEPIVRPGLARRVAVDVTIVTVIVASLVSGIALMALGVPYGAPGGSILTKIHPATYLSVLAVIAWMVAVGGPGRFVGSVVIEHPSVAVFAIAVGVMLFHAVVVMKLSISPIVDTFVLPILMLSALTRLDERERERLEWIMHAIMIVDIALGIFEYLSGWRLTPMYDTDGVTVMHYDWRSSALFGHPLSNAFHIGAYLVALACGATPRMHPILRLVLMGSAALSLVGFGGRTAMGLAYVMVAALAAIAALRTLLGGRFRLTHAAIGVGLVTIGAIGEVLFVDGGGADRFIDLLNEDHGSAQTRVSMFYVFGNLSWDQFLLWPDPSLIEQAQRDFALRIGIESSEVGLVAAYGLIPMLLFGVAISMFMRELVRITSPATWWTIAYFVVVMSASNGVAAKSTNFAIHIGMIFAIMPRPATLAAKTRLTG